MRPIRVSGVDEIDAQLQRSPQHSNRFLVIRWLAPHPRPGNSHRAKAEAIDTEVAADIEGAAEWCYGWCHSLSAVWTNEIAIEPSPTADATRFTFPARTSPTAKTPGRLVSSRCGERARGHF